MNAPRWLTALAVLLSAATAADAQFVPAYGPPGHFGGAGFRYSRARGRGSVSFSVGVFRGGHYPPAFCSPYGITSTRVTVINVAPPQPLFFFPPPGPFLEGLPLDVLPRPRVPEMLPVPDLPPMPPVPPVPGEKPRAPAKDKEKKDDEKPKKEDKPPPKKARPDPELPRPPGPEADPRDEFARLMRAGRELFEDQQYGRAANRFRQASRTDAAQPLPYFLLAQSLLQQGNYHDARDAIVAGLRRKPDWPATKFRPLEYYGANQEEYSDLLRALERTQARHPDDPALLLVRGFALWFDGRKEQAAALFRRARKGPDRDAVERFLAALPDGPAL